jgi:hypothetical protein
VKINRSFLLKLIMLGMVLMPAPSFAISKWEVFINGNPVHDAYDVQISAHAKDVIVVDYATPEATRGVKLNGRISCARPDKFLDASYAKGDRFNVTLKSKGAGKKTGITFTDCMITTVETRAPQKIYYLAPDNIR